MFPDPAPWEWITTGCSLVAVGATLWLFCKRARIYLGLYRLHREPLIAVRRLARIDLRRAAERVAMALVFLAMTFMYLAFVPPPIRREVSVAAVYAGLGVLLILAILTVGSVVDVYEESSAEKLYKRAKQSRDNKEQHIG